VKDQKGKSTLAQEVGYIKTRNTTTKKKGSFDIRKKS